VLLVDVGHTKSTAVVVLVQNANGAGSDVTCKKAAVQHDEALGAYHFDMQLFQHFAATKCATCKVRTVFMSITARWIGP
jgi:molecular chaperone DnaK (HSP70)